MESPARHARHDDAHDSAQAHAAEHANEHANEGGLLHSARTLLATLVATARTRGELLQVELEEERLRVAGITVFAAAAAFFLGLAVVVLTFFLIVLFWDSHRLLVSGLLALAYFMIGLVCANVARQRARVKSKLFATSLAELAKDGERLKPY